MRIGICGGTFDPFHRGHLDPILAVCDTMQWDRVLYIPAWRQPFKTERHTAAGAHRFAMAALATREIDFAYVLPIELERGGVSYSVETLEELHRQFDGAAFDWIIGDDNLEDLGRWHDPARLFQLARFVVLTRTGATAPTEDPPLAGAEIVFASNNTVAVSSTEIRDRVRAGESIEGFVDPLVSRYIHHYGLYREGPL